MINKEQLVCVLNKLPNDYHSLPCISFYESLESFFIMFLEEMNIKIHNMKELKIKKNFINNVWKSWKYIGKGVSVENGFFNSSYDFYIERDGHKISISKYDLPHFLANIVNLNEFVEWVDKNKLNDEIYNVCINLNICNNEHKISN